MTPSPLPRAQGLLLPGEREREIHSLCMHLRQTWPGSLYHSTVVYLATPRRVQNFQSKRASPFSQRLDSDSFRSSPPLSLHRNVAVKPPLPTHPPFIGPHSLPRSTIDQLLIRGRLVAFFLLPFICVGRSGTFCHRGRWWRPRCAQ